MKAAQTVSPLYLLERFDVGIVQLDAERMVVAMNDYARRVLPVDEKQPFDRFVLSFHPERSKPKVDFLLNQAATCPVTNPPPMTMIINIPERVLMIKVSCTSDARGVLVGYVLVFYDITEVVAGSDSGESAADTPGRRQLHKVPTVMGQRIVLVPADEILRLYSEGHYTQVVTAEGHRFCNLAISDLEGRLDPEHFMRVHRSHIVDLRKVQQLVRAEGRVSLQLAGDETLVPVARSSTAAVLARLGRITG
ncbi:MAG: LytTR family transcriptional regulator [Methylibium sp.]|nr:LytTR family transcriptional regulator [Methylibium sp.]